MKLPQFSIGSFILGLVIAVSAYHGYIVYKMNLIVIATANQTQVNNNRIAQIETFLNDSIAKQQESINARKQVEKKVDNKEQK